MRTRTYHTALIANRMDAGDFFDRGVRGFSGSFHRGTGTTGDGAREVEVVTDNFGVSLV